MPKKLRKIVQEIKENTAVRYEELMDDLYYSYEDVQEIFKELNFGLKLEKDLQELLDTTDAFYRDIINKQRLNDLKNRYNKFCEIRKKWIGK